MEAIKPNKGNIIKRSLTNRTAHQPQVCRHTYIMVAQLTKEAAEEHCRKAAVIRLHSSRSLPAQGWGSTQTSRLGTRSTVGARRMRTKSCVWSAKKIETIIILYYHCWFGFCCCWPALANPCACCCKFSNNSGLLRCISRAISIICGLWSQTQWNLLCGHVDILKQLFEERV